MARREFQMPSVLESQTPRGVEYYIRYRVKVLKVGEDGKPTLDRRERWEALGLKRDGANVRNPEAITFRQAERKRDEKMREVNGQVYTVQAQIPFESLLSLFAKNHLPDLAVPTQATYRSWIAQHIAPAFTGRRLCDIKPLDIQIFLAGLKVAPTTRQSIRGVLSSIWGRARAWGYQEKSPVLSPPGKKGIRRIRQKRIPAPGDVKRILDAVDEQRGLIIETLLWTGMRISECLGLRPRHFDLERCVVRIEERQCRGDVGNPKSEASVRTLPLGHLADKYAVHLTGMGSESFVFTDKNGRPYRDNELLANYLTPRLKKLGLKWPGFGWHTFRRLLATWMDESGASLFEIMEQLGHSQPSTTKLYVVGNVARRARMVEAMQERFAGEA